ncbi:MAG: FxsA family protein [Solirubrobacterales bacterium]|nr:FxsA family protein [Solirubrobacterales bacterium]
MPFLVLLFVVVPLVELYAILQVGGLIGAGPTIALLIVDSIAGALLLRWQGRAAWRQFRAATAAGKVPAREVLDGALLLFGGTLLLTPGFVTDALGLALMIPPFRALVRRSLLGGVAKRMMGPAAIPGGMAYRAGSARWNARPSRQGPAGAHDEDIVDSTAHDIDQDQLP